MQLICWQGAQVGNLARWAARPGFCAEKRQAELAVPGHTEGIALTKRLARSQQILLQIQQLEPGQNMSGLSR